jgi:hypothetical protein
MQTHCPATAVDNSVIGIMPGTPIAESASNSDAGGDYNQVLPVTITRPLQKNLMLHNTKEMKCSQCSSFGSL